MLVEELLHALLRALVRNGHAEYAVCDIGNVLVEARLSPVEDHIDLRPHDRIFRVEVLSALEGRGEMSHDRVRFPDGDAVSNLKRGAGVARIDRQELRRPRLSVSIYYLDLRTVREDRERSRGGFFL